MCVYIRDEKERERERDWIVLCCHGTKEREIKRACVSEGLRDQLGVDFVT